MGVCRCEEAAMWLQMSIEIRIGDWRLMEV